MLGLTPAVNCYQSRNTDLRIWSFLIFSTFSMELEETRNFNTKKLIMESRVKLKTVFSTQLVRSLCLHFLCLPALLCTGREKGAFFSEKINKIHMIMLFIWSWYFNTKDDGNNQKHYEFGSVTCPHSLASDGWTPPCVWVFPPPAASTIILASDWSIQVTWP